MRIPVSAQAISEEVGHPQRTDPMGSGLILLAGRGVRFSSALIDTATMMSPTLPLAIAAATLRVAELVYIVMPVAFLTVWLWMLIWQSLNGSSFGKAMLGLRLERVEHGGPTGVPRALARSAVFAGTLGLAALPMMVSRRPRMGLHDRVSGLRVVDDALRSNSAGARYPTRLRRSTSPGLRRVSAPIPLSTSRRR